MTIFRLLLVNNADSVMRVRLTCVWSRRSRERERDCEPRPVTRPPGWAEGSSALLTALPEKRFIELVGTFFGDAGVSRAQVTSRCRVGGSGAFTFSMKGATDQRCHEDQLMAAAFRCLKMFYFVQFVDGNKKRT